MAFTATFYNCSDDPNKVNKTLVDGTEVQKLRPTDDCDLISPVFLLDYNSTIAGCNYCVVGAPFNRHYFITNIDIGIGNVMKIHCSVDPLTTYADDIKKCNACIIRSESVGAPTYVVDNKLPINPNKKELKSIILKGGFTPNYDAGAFNLLVSMT